MNSAEPAATRLADYAPPPFLVDDVDLDFELDARRTLVRARLRLRRNPAAAPAADLVLDGHGLDTRAVRVDGEAVSGNRVEIAAQTLTVRDVPDAFVLDTEVAIRPGANKSLEGLYASSGNLCTQCEAQGFRKITWFPDRPDVMARYRTRIVADPRRYPVMLSNGNDVARGALDDGRRYVVWEDPYPKPSYLFALVAGRLECVEDTFTTRSGREVALRIHVQPHNVDRCDHAMRSLRRAMRWDEDVYGLEYDLDTFMIVAVDDFNMGAMENKGLNVFNSAYVLARPDTATDRDFAAIETVIAHEYFHNWTGNRVTCRDWFQLSLKEGLTVFRDQEFSADAASRAVKRIRDVRLLRTHQFAEDAGPMAHPVRPDSYIEISNFYTVTIYNKGAEVIRMMHTLLGDERFQAGMRLYFERHDGQAVTTGDFVASMEAASGMDLGQFRRWYAQAGTPVLGARGTWDPERSQYVLDIEQRTPPTPGQPEKLPLHVPLRLALLGEDGRNIPLHCEGSGLAGEDEAVLDLRESHRTFRFSQVSTRPVASLARGFSAPVKVDIERSDEELAFLIARETDAFNRWDAAQEYATRLMLRMVDDRLAGAELDLPDGFVSAVRALLLDETVDPAFAAEALTLPSESNLADRMEVIAVEAIHEGARGGEGDARVPSRGRLRPRLRRQPTLRPLPLRRRGRGAPGPEEPLPGLPDGARRTGDAFELPPPARERGQHDRRARRPRLLRRLARPGARRAARVVRGAVEGRAPGAGQVVLAAGDVTPAGHPGPRPRTRPAPGVRPGEPEPGAGADRRVLPCQSAAVPRCLRRRVPVPLRARAGHRCIQSAVRGAAAGRGEPVAASRCGARGADAGRAGADSGDAGDFEGLFRGGEEVSGVRRHRDDSPRRPAREGAPQNILADTWWALIAGYLPKVPTLLHRCPKFGAKIAHFV